MFQRVIPRPLAYRMVYGKYKIRDFSYESESAALVDAARKGLLPNVNPNDIKQCDLCTRIYLETLQGRTIEDLPPVCAVRNAWVKTWMENHDSYDIVSPLSLDPSRYTDDEELHKMAEESVVVPDDIHGKSNSRCGLYCCQ